MPTVSVLKVDRYDEALLDEAIAAHFDALNVAKDLSPTTRVLLKPNLLAARAPELSVTTHPQVLLAIARWLHAHGVTNITVADSPGGVYNSAMLAKLYTACGLDVLKPLCTLNTDASSAAKDGFTLLTPVLEADYIINCPKLKTHGLTVVSAGVKNLFGCIPGLKKPEFHCLKPTIGSFSKLLIKLSLAVKPQLTVLDAIDCMEGNGPGGGEKRHMGYTLCSRSVYALDEQATLLMGLRTAMSPVLKAAKAQGLLNEETTLVGDALVPADPPFSLPDAITGQERFFTANGLFHHFFGRGRTYPAVQFDKCVGCGRCAESCPKHLITITGGKAVISRKGCISCFCCQEMCPAHAIDALSRRQSKR